MPRSYGLIFFSSKEYLLTDAECLELPCRTHSATGSTFEHILFLARRDTTLSLVYRSVAFKVYIPIQIRPEAFIWVLSLTEIDTMSTNLLVRHIQDHVTANTTEEQHWGYPSRVVPCSNDRGSCEYLKGVYWMHDVSMLYTFILWGVLLGIAVVWVTIRGWRMGGPALSVGSYFDRLCDRINHLKRRWLLPDAPVKWLFGRVSRLQVLIFGCLLAFLLIFS